MIEHAAGPEAFSAFFIGAFFLVGGLFSLLLFGFWIWMLVDCLKYEQDEANQKLVWTLVIIFANWIGALIYFFVRRQDRRRHQTSRRY